MPSYFEQMRSGMQLVQQLLLELQPEARFDWGPMDNDANYPLFIVREGRKVLLFRFSKDSLAAMSDAHHQGKVRELLRQSLRTSTRLPR